MPAGPSAALSCANTSVIVKEKAQLSSVAIDAASARTSAANSSPISSQGMAPVHGMGCALPAPSCPTSSHGEGRLVHRLTRVSPVSSASRLPASSQGAAPRPSEKEAM